jgi:hypothetical protein
MTTYFGNTLVHLRRASVVGAIFATVTGAVFLSVAHAHGHLSAGWVSGILLALCIGAIP